MTTLVRTAVLGLGGAALAAVAAGQTWATATVTAPGVRSAAARGSEVAPLALPLALVTLAAWGSILVLRRTGRRIVAVIGLLAAVGTAVTVAASFGDRAAAARDAVGSDRATVSTTAWPVVALLGALLAAGACAVAVRRAGTWPEMSRRYDRPGDAAGVGAPDGAPGGVQDGTAAAGGRETSDRDLWRALDEGRDPTA